MDRKTKIIIGLSILLVLLIGFVGYSYWLNYQQEKYNEAYYNGMNDGLITILTGIQNNGYVQIPIGNQTFTLGQYQEVQNGS